MRSVLGDHAAAVDAAARRIIGDGVAARIARRDPAAWGGDAQRQAAVATRLGWLAAPSAMTTHLSELDEFTADVRSAGYTDIVLLGMGGSSLAPEVLRQAIQRRRAAPRLHVLDSTDPATILEVERRIDPGRTLFIVSSKSGGTIEMATLYAHFREVAERASGARAGDQFVAVTDPGTPLEELARVGAFRRVFLGPPDVGGRYSALTYFGLVPAAAMGLDVGRLLDAGERAAHEALSAANEHLRLGAAIGALARAGVNKLTLVVAPEVAALGLWIEQLIAESTGKDGLGVVPVDGEPLGKPRAYGRDRLFVQVRLEGGATGEQDAVIGALVAEGHPAVVIDMDSPYDLGSQFYAWEYATAVAGAVLGINPFDEPNVQESKDNTARVLRQYEQSGELDAFDGTPGLVSGGGDRPADLTAALGTLLGALEDGGYLAITAFLAQTEDSDVAFAAVRSLVRDATGAATTLGYGPRFLHSTGQLHKGGPPGGVFLQVTASDRADLPIPGRPWTFGQLKRAQALGDFQSLAAHGRPVLRVHLGEAVDNGLAALVEAARRALAT